MKKLRKVKAQWCAVMVCGLSAAVLLAAPAPAAFADTTGTDASSANGGESTQT